MKVLMVLALVVLAAASAFAYGASTEGTAMTAVVARTTNFIISEPVAMLLSGGLLLVIAGAVRRLEA